MRHVLLAWLLPAAALAQSGAYTKDAGVRVATGNVPEIAQFGAQLRLYYCGQGGILSVVSSDGLAFTAEAGVRVAPGAQGSTEEIVCDPSIVKLPTGQVRMYYKGADGPGGPGQANHRIFSAISSDGLAFTKEGLRYENLGAPDFGWTSVPDAILLPSGQVRIYFTGGQGIESVLSNDGLTFAPEAGARMADGVDPDISLRPDGTYVLFYARGLPAQHLAVAVSGDGLAFTARGDILAAGGTCDGGGTVDPTAIRLPSGRWRVYYGGLGSCGNVTLSAISPWIIQRRITP